MSNYISQLYVNVFTYAFQCWFDQYKLVRARGTLDTPVFSNWMETAIVKLYPKHPYKHDTMDDPE